ncbi:MAG: 3-deoxy-manno-octulosonate cytidylyltransferase [Nitrospirota bacterium]
MKVIGIIPSRYNSSRFKGKALSDICGKPMIQHVYERAKKARLLDELIVATDDKRIYNAVMKFGGKVVLTKKHNSGTDRIAEAAEKIKADIIVNIQGDEPLISSRMIDSAIGFFKMDKLAVMGTIKKEITSPDELYNPNIVKVVTDNNNSALYFSRRPIPFLRDNENNPPSPPFKIPLCPPLIKGDVGGLSGGKGGFSDKKDVPIPRNTYYKHIGLYLYKRPFLLKFAKMKQTSLEKKERLEQLRALENGYKIKVYETKYDTIGVDTSEDLEMVKKMICRGRR